MGQTRAKRSTFLERVDWLLENTNLWHKEYLRYDASKTSRFLNERLHKQIVMKMKAAGLFAETTYWKDVPLKREMSVATRELQLERHRRQNND